MPSYRMLDDSDRLIFMPFEAADDPAAYAQGEAISEVHKNQGRRCDMYRLEREDPRGWTFVAGWGPKRLG